MPMQPAAAARLAPLMNNPAFWHGALAARRAGNGQHHDEAVTRLHLLIDFAEAKKDVMGSAEFERWLGYKGRNPDAPAQAEAPKDGSP